MNSGTSISKHLCGIADDGFWAWEWAFGQLENAQWAQGTPPEVVRMRARLEAATSGPSVTLARNRYWDELRVWSGDPASRPGDSDLARIQEHLARDAVPSQWQLLATALRRAGLLFEMRRPSFLVADEKCREWRYIAAVRNERKPAEKVVPRVATTRRHIALLQYVLGFFGSHKVDGRNTP